MKGFKIFRNLGPGLITGISDNDPSGIATCARSGADLGAMSAALGLLIPINGFVGLGLFTLITLFSIIYFPYKKYVQILKWLCLFILIYPVSLFIVNTPWLDLLKNTFIPDITFAKDYFFMLTALFLQ